MPRIAIKICGLSTPETLDAALKGGAAHVGFMSYAPSPRHVTRDQVAALSQRVPGHVHRIGVMVDPEDAKIDEIALFVDALQLHRVSPERAAAIRARTGKTVWAAIPVKSRADLDGAQHYAGAVDGLLYDSSSGMGVRIDWTLLQGHRPALPWGLAGGLDPDNVAEAIRITGTPLVDVSSGVESAPGLKDVDKIAAFCKAVGQG